MYCNNNSRLFLLAGLLFFSELVVAARVGDTSLYGKAYTGRAYDSNVSLSDFDVSTRIGDNTATTGFSLGVGHDFFNSVKAGLSYSYADKRYDKFSEFDLRTGLLGASLNVKMPGKYKIGFNYNQADVALSGRDYLSLKKWSPSLSWFVNKKTYFRLSYSLTDKEYIERPIRNANNAHLGANWYVFLKGTKNFLSLGYDFKEEDSADDAYDYRAHHVKTAWTKKTKWFSQEEKIKIGFQYEKRIYTDLSSGDGGLERKDDRLRYSIAYTVVPIRHVYAAWEYEYSHFLSNVDIYKYDQHLLSLTLGGKF